MDVIVGTAGHIDHGKTALVKALTGIDADRLPEEKRRGITVDLGFAEMSVGDMHFGFVDVPGHERFVKNMLAGASGIDLVLLVIAADEGVMPQTREHFDICRLLGINAGVVVLTKTDLVDGETLELAKLDAAELVSNSFLDGSPAVCVSSRTGDGVETLKEIIHHIAAAMPARDDQLVTRLPIDRSFSMKGFGAVVTGTLASGEITEGSELELLPTTKKARVRGIQSHGQTVRFVSAGQRVAVNLGGIDHSRVVRGMVLVEPNVLQPTQIFDAEVEVLSGAPKPLRSRQRVRIHIGTVEALARTHILNDEDEIATGGKDYAQIRLEVPVVAVPGERFILRTYSPQATIAGGRVIDAFALKHRRKEISDVRRYLSDLAGSSGDSPAKLRIMLESAGARGLSYSDLQARTALRREILDEAIDSNIRSGFVIGTVGHFITTEAVNTLSNLVIGAVADFHAREPLTKGMPRESIRDRAFAHLPSTVFQAVIASLEASGEIVVDKENVRLDSHETKLSPAEAALSDKIADIYRKAGLEVPKLDDALAESTFGTSFTPRDARKLFQLSLDAGEIVKVADEFYFARNAIDDLAAKLRQFADKTSDRLIDVPTFKDLAGVSRKYAIPLLEYFDREHITSRSGDKRIILQCENF